jgi:hypothetical protein
VASRLSNPCESKESTPHFENLRKVFNAENDALDELYKPLQNFTDEILKRDFQNRGMRLYGEWGRTKRKEFLLSYYDNEFFRAQYARNRFQNSARSFLQALALRILPQSPPVEKYLTSVTRVISIGVGPASDVAGFLAYLRTRGMNQRLTYFVLDQCSQWNEYIRTCDRHWAGKYNVSMWFKNARIVNMDSLNLLPDADMIVFSFSNTALMEPSIWPVLQRRYRLIIVLDGIKEILIDSFFECQFQKFQLNEKTNLYYTFNFENDPHEQTAGNSSENLGMSTNDASLGSVEASSFRLDEQTDLHDAFNHEDIQKEQT